jgi:hypothetical protein
MFAVSPHCFFQSSLFATPSIEQKDAWINLALVAFEESRNNDEQLTSVLIDGLFVNSKGRLLTYHDLKEYSLDFILTSCINNLIHPHEDHPFQFRPCNIKRILAYYNQLNLHHEVSLKIPPIDQYKISLAMYHIFVNSPHGIFYDQMLVDAELDQVELIQQDKREFERHMIEMIKLELNIVDDEYVFVYSSSRLSGRL